MKNLEVDIQKSFLVVTWSFLVITTKLFVFTRLYAFLRDKSFLCGLFVFHILLAIWLKQICLIFLSFVSEGVSPLPTCRLNRYFCVDVWFKYWRDFLEISWQWTLETKNIYCQHLFGNYVNTFYAFVLNNCIIKSL